MNQKTDLSLEKNIKLAVQAALEAGKAILEVYERDDIGIEFKADDSPLTLADKLAHEAIVKSLEPSKLPILSEESALKDYGERKTWKQFWLVDPLDGTKEFIKRNGEFTVNIALIDGTSPVLGVVYVPVQNLMFYGAQGFGAFRLADFDRTNLNGTNFQTDAVKLPDKNPPGFRIVASRSHLSAETSTFIEGLMRKYPDARIVSKGSSLKLCMIAEGEADIYPRFAPTKEWDTAAGHAIVAASGGKVVMASNDEPLRYNKEDILNPWFIAYRQTHKMD